MPLAAGTRLGAYEIVSALGAGGMGEVYRARDTRLNRDVALKILPDAFAADPQRLARFEREAQLLASLNHPNIAQIYGLAESTAVRALVMELVDGATLVGRRLPVDEALAVARQIAGALEAAHEKGIIHRDLKPGNVMITADGHVKLLDFGLGKSLGAEPSEDPSNSPTVTAMSTQAGVLLGTAAYMSPEQAKGRAADKRSDIWAFGCMLFELLTGKRAFDGEDVTDTLAAIVRAEPDWTALRDDVPPHIRGLLRRCMQKDRTLRARDIGDVLLALNEPPAAAPDGTPKRGGWRDRVLGLSAGVVVGAGSLGVAWWLRAPSLPPETRLEIAVPAGASEIELSPDGRQIAFSVAVGGGGTTLSGEQKSGLWLRGLDQTAAHPLAGTEDIWGRGPFWSPDSRYLGFLQSGALKRIDIATGFTETIVDSGAFSRASWSRSNDLLIARGNAPLSRFAAGRISAATILTDGMTGHSAPLFLPDGRHFLFTSAGSEAVRGLYLGSLDTSYAKRLSGPVNNARFLAPDWLIFIRQDALVAQKLDLKRGMLTGSVLPIADSVASVTTSDDGTIAYRPTSAVMRQLTWFDRGGRALGTLGDLDTTTAKPALSPDGTRVAVSRRGVWIVDAVRATKLTDGGAPVWSPDGSRLAYSGTIGNAGGNFIRSTNGTGGDTTIVERRPGSPVWYDVTSWSHDGRFVLVDADTNCTPCSSFADVWTIPLTGDRKPVPFLSNNLYGERLAVFSPNGRWVTYQSNESGRAEIYVTSFPDHAGKWQVSSAGGAQPHWRADGRELYWIAPDARLMAAPIVERGTAIEAGAPTSLFQTRIYLGGSEDPLGGQYDVAPDGRFLVNTVVGDATVPPIIVIHNWRPKAN